MSPPTPEQDADPKTAARDPPEKQFADAVDSQDGPEDAVDTKIVDVDWEQAVREAEDALTEGLKKDSDLRSFFEQHQSDLPVHPDDQSLEAVGKSSMSSTGVSKNC